jgi:flavin-dependent dehydrogenase
MSDVIIIGGGPAGSALGCYLSLAGISNSIFESANHPRPHVGESLVTNTTRIFKEIDFLNTMEREGFIKKYGAAWHASLNREKLFIEFAEFPLEGVNQPYSYHIDRSKFDLLLLKHAESLGSNVYQGSHVVKVLFKDQRACGVRVKVGDKTVDLSCKVVVDASGRHTLLGNQLKLKIKDPFFNQYAIHAWFEGLDRGDDKTSDFIHIYFLPVERGWVWQIPVTDKITSVGVVAEKATFRRAHMDIETYFNTHVQSSVKLAQVMRNAHRVNDYTTEGDYSYSMSKFVGDGYLLVGDAARFVDPIFSSGISVALHSAKFAAESISHGFEIDDFSQATFEPYEKRVRQGIEIWYEFIRLYYKLLPLFTYFIQIPKYRLQVFRLLQGEVFDRSEAPVLEAMRNYIEAVEKSDNHVFKNRLTDIPIDSNTDSESIETPI